VHATNHYRELGAIRSTVDNLQVAIDGETYEVEEMYPAFRAVAELQEEMGARRTTDWAWQAERIHAAMYQKAKQAAANKEDLDLGPVFICEVCGYTVEGKAPTGARSVSHQRRDSRLSDQTFCGELGCP